MFKRKTNAIRIEDYVPDSAAEKYKEFLRDLATVYPEIVQTGYYYYGDPLALYRTTDIRIAAEAIRAAENKKVADALIKEFRGK